MNKSCLLHFSLKEKPSTFQRDDQDIHFVLKKLKDLKKGLAINQTSDITYCHALFRPTTQSTHSLRKIDRK